MKYLKTFENNFDLNSWEDEERPYESTPEDISIFYEELSKMEFVENLRMEDSYEIRFRVNHPEKGRIKFILIGMDSYDDGISNKATYTYILEIDGEIGERIDSLDITKYDNLQDKINYLIDQV